jgi:Fe-S-cluster-containing hydrogenase component 2
VGAIHIDESGIAKKCNLCLDQETPSCVLACPTEALKLDSEDVLAGKRDRIAKDLEKIKLIMKD